MFFAFAQEGKRFSSHQFCIFSHTGFSSNNEFFFIPTEPFFLLPLKSCHLTLGGFEAKQHKKKLTKLWMRRVLNMISTGAEEGGENGGKKAEARTIYLLFNSDSLIQSVKNICMLMKLETYNFLPCFIQRRV